MAQSLPSLLHESERRFGQGEPSPRNRRPNVPRPHEVPKACLAHLVWHRGSMNIAVQAEGLKFTAQIRAYVEYRMFSAISRFGGRCVSLSVSLEESESAQLGTQYRCAAIL